MLKMVKNKNGEDCPHIQCAHCEKLIENAELALAMWRSEDSQLSEDGKVYIVHKECSYEFEGDDYFWKSQELIQFMRRLVHNTKADITDDRIGAMLDEL
jgi:hypothetical protein